MKLIQCLALGAMIAAAPAFAQQQGKSGKSAADAKGIREMAEANMAEVEAGKVAVQKAKSEEVKKFAQHMVDEHGKMLQEVQSMAQSKGVDLPKEPKTKHKAAMKKLEGADGDKFDQAYMDQMVKDHRQTAKDVGKIAKSSKDPELKAAAQKALPDIQEHLKMAQQIAGKSGGSSRGASSGASSQPKNR